MPQQAQRTLAFALLWVEGQYVNGSITSRTQHLAKICAELKSFTQKHQNVKGGKAHLILDIHDMYVSL